MSGDAFLLILMLVIAGTVFLLRGVQLLRRKIGAAVSSAETTTRAPVREISLPTSTAFAGASRPLTIREWFGLLNDQYDEAPHTLVVAPSGAGKTVAVGALLQARAGKVLVIDPKKRPGKWGGAACVGLDPDGGYEGIKAAIQSFLKELRRRLVALQTTPEGQPLNFEPVTLAIDEFFTIKVECPDEAPELFKLVSSIGREVRVRLVAITTSDRVVSLGLEGQGDVRESFCFIRLGKAAVAVQSACAQQTRPACIEWRGQHLPIATEGLLELSRRPIDRRRWWRQVESDVLHQETQHTGIALGEGQKMALHTEPHHTSMPGIGDMDAKIGGMPDWASILPGMSREERIQALVALGVSANAIAATVGGDRNAVLARVRELRGEG